MVHSERDAWFSEKVLGLLGEDEPLRTLVLHRGRGGHLEPRVESCPEKSEAPADGCNMGAS